MNRFRRFLRLFRRNRGMVGTPPPARQIPADPAAHAMEFSHRYAEPMDYHVSQRMGELGIPTERIGASKYDYPHRAFWPEERTGGGNVPGRRLTVDSGVFNPDLMVDRGEAGAVWARTRLRDRIDARIAHEDAESLTHDHDRAEEMARDTPLPISAVARRVLQAIPEGKRQR